MVCFACRTVRGYPHAEADQSRTCESGFFGSRLHPPCSAISRKTRELYRLHLILTGAAIALLSVGYVISEGVALSEAHGRNMVFGDTARGITPRQTARSGL